MKFSLRYAAKTALMAAIAVPLCAKVLDRAVATINGEPIMLSEFEKNARMTKTDEKECLPE